MGDHIAVREAIDKNLADKFLLDDCTLSKQFTTYLCIFNADMLIYVQDKSPCHNSCNDVPKNKAGSMAKSKKRNRGDLLNA
jgi:hypothetical protein